jgi:prepilin-type processing-associated H-X9-DG protein
VQIGVLICPSEINSPSNPPASNYAAVHHDVEAPIDVNNNGVFFLNSRIRRDEITDGLAHTLFIGERIVEPNPDLGWMSGTRSTLRNTGAALNSNLRVVTPWAAPVPVGEGAEPTVQQRSAAAAESEPKQEGAENPPQPEVSDAKVTTTESQSTGGGATGDPTLVVGGFASYHATGANFAFGDGSVRFIPETINLQILQQLAHRADGKLSPKDY